MNATQQTPSQREVERLRSEAGWAYLDGRTKRAKELNKQADKMSALLRNAASRGVA